MCNEIRRAEACVDWSALHALEKRRGEGDCVKEGERERVCVFVVYSCIGGGTTPQPSILRLILNAAALAAASPTLLCGTGK
jgi:hypothetical protein